MKTTSCNERKHYAFDKAPRCGAKTKHNNGPPCRCPAVRDKRRCRIHGGARGSGAQPGNVNAITHGLTTAEMKKFRKAVKIIIHDAKTINKST
jgi:hypothetical protein